MTIIKVAHNAGVSKSTVSRVINNLPGVKPEVILAVRQAIKRIGYVQPLLRRGPKPGLKRGVRTGTVTLMSMCCPARDLYRMPVFPTLMHGIERALAENGLKLMLANLNSDAAATLSSIETDGILLFGKWDAMPATVRAQLRQKPAVWIMREHSDPQGHFDHVFFDNAAVGRIAADYFLENGIKHAAYLNVAKDHSAFPQRQKDFTAVMTNGGAKVSVFEPEGASMRLELATFQALVERMLELPDRPTGIFVPADGHLPGLYYTLQQNGLKPGQDFKIIACDNEEEFLGQLDPRPATIDTKMELMGRQAVKQLLWRMQHANETSRMNLFIEPVLVPPQSAPARVLGSRFIMPRR